MKNLFAIIIISAFIWSCAAGLGKTTNDSKPHISAQKKADSADEWEITVFDAEYENFVSNKSPTKIDVHRKQFEIQKSDSRNRMEQ